MLIVILVLLIIGIILCVKFAKGCRKGYFRCLCHPLRNVQERKEIKNKAEIIKTKKTMI